MWNSANILVPDFQNNVINEKTEFYATVMCLNVTTAIYFSYASKRTKNCSV